jgi:hypothetical protein
MVRQKVLWSANLSVADALAQARQHPAQIIQHDPPGNAIDDQMMCHEEKPLASIGQRDQSGAHQGAMHDVEAVLRLITQAGHVRGCIGRTFVTDNVSRRRIFLPPLAVSRAEEAQPKTGMGLADHRHRVAHRGERDWRRAL